MLEAVGKNLWLLLTLVLPGLFTYGTWRAILILEPGHRLPAAALAGLDDSGLASASVVVAIALLQQAGAIAIEAALSLLAGAMRTRWPCFHALFRERFALAAAGRLDENATRIVGNFFLSMNMCLGLGLLLLYFLAYEGLAPDHWVPLGLLALLAATLITTAFRLGNAMSIMAVCRAPEAAAPATLRRL